MQALESSGRIDKNGQLQLDAPLDVTDKRVKVIVLISGEEELSDQHWLPGMKGNQAFDFLNDSEEDIYSVNDGEAFHDEV